MSDYEGDGPVNSLMKTALYIIVFGIVFTILQSINVSAAITEITSADMDRDMVCQDMEGCPAGAISGTHPCFNAIFIQEARLLGDWFDDDDILNSGPDGKALCCYRHELTIVEPDGAIFDPFASGSGYRFELEPGKTAGQFSWRNVDQSGWTAEITVFKGGVILDSITRSMSGYDPAYFESSDGFDAFEIVTTSSTGGWCIDDLCLARFSSTSGTPTPTPTVTPTATLADIPDVQPGMNVFLALFFGWILCRWLVFTTGK